MVSQSQQQAGSEFPHPLDARVFCCLCREGMAAVAGMAAVVRVVSLGTQGAGVHVVNEDGWDNETVKAVRKGVEDKWGSLPPMSSLCSAAHHRPAAGEKSARLSGSRCIRDRLDRFP